MPTIIIRDEKREGKELFKDFDILKLKSTIWYIYRPNGLNFYCIIYLAAGIFIPILIGTVTHRIFEFMKEHTLKSMQKKQSDR